MQDYVLEKIEGYPLLRSDIPTRNGRLYTEECLQTIADTLKEFTEYHIPVVTTQKDNNPCLNINYACGAVTKAEIKDHVLYVDIDIFSTDFSAIRAAEPKATIAYSASSIKSPTLMVKTISLIFVTVMSKSVTH